MNNYFEIYVNNGGGVTLFVLFGGAPVAAFTGLQMCPRTLGQMIARLAYDNYAWMDWDDAWDEENEAVSLEELYHEDADRKDHDSSELVIYGDANGIHIADDALCYSPKSLIPALLGWSD